MTHDSAYQRVLDALHSGGQKIRTTGDHRAVAQCPAHDDRAPSLSITAIEGQALIHCHAGCDTLDVLDALHLVMADLYDERNGARYPYDDGRIVARSPDKRFHQSGNTAGRPQLYRLSKVTAAAHAGTTIYLVEGEKDVHAIESLGAIGTTAPMGATNFTKVDVTPLRDAKLIVIPDRDEAGQRWLRDVLAHLDGLASSVEIRAPKTGKDAADHIAAGHDLADLLPAEDPTAADREAFAATVREHLPRVDWHALWVDDGDGEEWIVEPLLAAGRLIAIYSAPKVGKSLLMLEVAVAVARGSTVLGVTPDRARRVLYVDFENDPKGDIRPRLQAMKIGPGDLSGLVYLSFPTLAALDSERGGAELIAAVGSYECEVVIIDTVSRAIRGEENDNDTWLNFYRHTGLRLKRAGVALVRLDHAGKDETKGQRGGSAKVGDVDAVWRLSEVVPDTTYRLDCQANRMPVTEKTLVLTRAMFPLAHRVAPAGRAAAWTAKVDAVRAAMDAVGLPRDSGAVLARSAIREAGMKASNEVIAEAVRLRRLVTQGELAVTDSKDDLSADIGDRGSGHPLSANGGDSAGQRTHESDKTAGQSVFAPVREQSGTNGDRPPGGTCPLSPLSMERGQVPGHVGEQDICPSCGFARDTLGHEANCPDDTH